MPQLTTLSLFSFSTKLGHEGFDDCLRFKIRSIDRGSVSLAVIYFTSFVLQNQKPDAITYFNSYAIEWKRKIRQSSIKYYHRCNNNNPYWYYMEKSLNARMDRYCAN